MLTKQTYFLILALQLILLPLAAKEVRRYTEFEAAFMSRLCDLAYGQIQNDPNLPENFDFTEASRYLHDIAHHGDGVKIGIDSVCRPVCVVVQGAFEKILADMKKNGEIIELSAVYVTPLPATPLRTSSSLNTFDYSVTLRQNTVRDMRAQGGRIFCVYSQKRYDDELKNKALEQLEAKKVGPELNQLTTYLNELHQHNTYDIPLCYYDLGGYIGAIYSITTVENQQFYMITEGTQIQDAAKDGLKLWRHSLIPYRFKGHERVRRIESVIKEINENKTEDSAFVLF